VACVTRVATAGVKLNLVDLDQWSRLVFIQPPPMNRPDQPSDDAPEAKRSRSEEALRIIEEYAADLREIIQKLRRHLS
jgi:hypothetical protein